MKTSLLDDAASDLPPPPSRPTGPAADAARGRRRLGRWLRQLAQLTVMLVGSVDFILEDRRQHPALAGTMDLSAAWARLRRAGSWLRALGDRVAAEARAARAGREPRQSDRDGEDWHEDLLRPPAWTRKKLEPAISIDGKPSAEVFAQICADLDAAATLLRSPSAVAKIAAIAAAARALLGEPAAGWTPLPVVVRRDGAAAALMNPRLPDAPAPSPPSPSPPSPPSPPDSG